jgi:hypothetical protein
MKPMYEIIDDTIYAPIGCDPWNRDNCHQQCPCAPGEDEDDVKKEDIGNGKVVITINGKERGAFTLNQKGDTVIDLSDEPLPSHVLYYGHKGEAVEMPKITSEDILSFDPLEFINIEDVLIPMPKYKGTTGRGAWGFIAIPKAVIRSPENNIIYDVDNQFSPASSEEYSFDNIKVNNSLYKVFITGVPIIDATTFIVKQPIAK